MQLKKYQYRVVMPELWDILNIIIIDHNGLMYPLMRVTPDEMRKLQTQPKEALPTHWSLDDRTITFYPRPDKDYPKLSVEYLPPKRTI